MIKTKQNKTVESNAVPTSKTPLVESGEQDWTPSETSSTFVVVRDNLRVSDKEYLTEDDVMALTERDFWQKIINRHPDGTKVGIVQYDKKKHRIW